MKKVLFSLWLLLPFVLEAQVTINPCARATDIHIVVIGSSTAAGTGPTNSANAWVNRYRDYLQQINPNNQVTNLAVGGTRTYHIMPDWFVSPTNRPSPNPAKNITQAITLGADAVIVNMPSNDGASGYSINEQMFNFHTIVDVADSVGIPVWVCTTQPRNGLSATQISIQVGVRDSINNAFGSKAIDFWNPFANAGNTVLNQWDSGDGVHLNDTAHAVLNQKVIAKAIPNEIGDTLNYTDHTITDIFIQDPTICGDSNMQLGVVTINLGTSSTLTENIQLYYYDYSTTTSTNLPLLPVSNLGACIRDTSYTSVNSYNGIHRDYDAFLSNCNDVDISNDTANQFELKTLGHPSISGLNDTVFSGANATLSAATGIQDTILWYDALSGGNIIGFGNSYTLNNVTSNQTVYSEAVSGPLHFKGNLFTTANTTTDWNGMMFDIVANANIIIDSFEIKVNTTGWQNVVAYNRLGTLVGNEMNNAVWNNWGIDSVNALTAGSFEIIRMPAVNLSMNDTLGVYLYMQNSSSQLSYLNSAATTYANNEISVINGTGVTHTFGVTYSPRNWSGRVYYHYGFNPQGDCQSERIPVSAIIKSPSSIEQVESIGLKIYPNPSTGIINFAGEKLPEQISIKDIQGKTVSQQSITLNQLDLSALQSGMYFLQFEIDGKKFVHKLLLD